MQQFAMSNDRSAGRSSAGLTLVEVMVAAAIVALASMMLYPAFRLSNSMIIANRQRQEAESLAMDRAMKLFNTFDFQSALMATNLPPELPPPGSLLPSNTEIRAMVVPGVDGEPPYKWDVEVRVKRDVLRPGGRRVTLTNDIVYRVTRYDIERN